MDYAYEMNVVIKGLVMRIMIWDSKLFAALEHHGLPHAGAK
jgi:hypothetical protein